MDKKIFIVRHCEAEGQTSDANLTEQGRRQANGLVEFFANVRVDRIISSPFLRAIQTVQPLVALTNIKVEIEQRLAERILSNKPLPDWMEKLKDSFKDLDVEFEGGESSRKAMNRVVNVVDEILESNAENIIIVTHGNLMSLLFKQYHPEYGYEEWKRLSNPDVFLLHVNNNHARVERIWRENPGVEHESS